MAICQQMEPLQIAIPALTLIIGGIGGFWLKWRDDQRDKQRFAGEMATTQEAQAARQRADLRVKMSRVGEYDKERYSQEVSIVFRNIGGSAASDVTFDVTSIHNRGCHVVWAPVHVPIPVLLSEQDYQVGGTITPECSEPLLVEIRWTDPIGKHHLELQLTASRGDAS